MSRLSKRQTSRGNGVDKPLAWWLCYPRNKFCPLVLSASIGIRWANTLESWAGDTCTAMDEPTSLKFVNRRIGELTKKYAAAQTTDARTSAIVEELSQLSIVRDELQKTQRKIYTPHRASEN